MSKSMYIALIIVGVVLIVVGVIGLSKHEETSADAIMYQYNDSEYAEESSYVEPQQENTVDDIREVKRPQSTVSEERKISVDSYRTESKSLSEKEKGNLFEGYVADCFKDRKAFRVLEWNQGVTSPEGVYAANNVNPDFHIEQVYSNDYKIDYYVEAKYLSHWRSKYTIELNDYQIDRYRRHQGATHRKVLLAIGVGGQADSPTDFYLVPLDSINEPKLSKSFLDKYATSQSSVKDYIIKYFREEVFKNSSAKGRMR